MAISVLPGPDSVLAGPSKPSSRGTFGTNGDDPLYGTREGDTISGLDGEDTIFGFGGDDWLYGGDGNDYLYGGDNDDHLYGGNGGDHLYGGAGDDHLYGGDDQSGHWGSNVLNGGAGADTLHGSPNGSDYADYSNSPGAVVVNLGTSKGGGSDAQGDIFYDIEHITGSAFGDILIGSGDANIIHGGGGDDQIFGLGGADILDGGAGADYLDGGDGSDTLDYRDSASGVMVNLTTGTGASGEAEGDTYDSIEQVYGSKFGDTLIGDANANTLYGGEGADMLFGGGGQDILFGGGGGQDTLTGGAGADSFSFHNSFYTGNPPTFITDFSQADGDVIDLIQGFGSPPAFSFIGTAGFSGTAWELRYEQVAGETIVSGDANGDGVGDFEIHCIGTINLTANDFIL